jgi:signal transduction histidine kinase
MLKTSQLVLGDLDVEHLSIYVCSVNEFGNKIFHQYNNRNEQVCQHVDVMALPLEFSTVNKNEYWVICPMIVAEQDYGYLVSKSQPVAAEFIEFIAPYFTEFLHSDALETRNERYRVQTELNERMISLGSLVSGVAHEVNTPIGNAKLAASSINESVKKIKKKVNEHNLTKSDFEDFIHDIEELSKIVFQSSDRAAELISNFKMVSVDQTAESKREIVLDEYIDSVLMSLKHQLKTSNVSLETELDQGISLDTYPGAIAQVITNLFMNALKHGFNGGKDKGIIRIELHKTQQAFLLNFSDNGAGATQTVLNHIFDPFFTTSRAKGGTGLGMHIVFNLVTQKLHWTIQVDSKPMRGFSVILKPILENY